MVKEMQDFCFDDDFFGISDADIEYDLSGIPSEPLLEYDNKRISCSFTGHRNISDEDRDSLLPRLKSTVLYLISQGVREFHCGGALGFDTVAASVVLDIARLHEGIKLILELPYDGQSSGWSDGDRRIYDFIKSKAHEVNIHGEKPKNREQAVKLLLARNRILVDKSHYCVCFLKKSGGGTLYTVNYAKLHDVQIINLFEQ